MRRHERFAEQNSFTCRETSQRFQSAASLTRIIHSACTLLTAIGTLSFLAFYLAETGALKEAIEIYRRVCDVTRKEHTLFRALALHNIGCSIEDHDEALGYLAQSIAIAPNYVRPHFQRSKRLAALGRVAEAIEALNVILASPHPHAYTKAEALIDRALQEPRWTVAVEDCDAAIELNAQNDYAWRLRAAIIADNISLEAGIVAVDEALRVLPAHELLLVLKQGLRF